MEYLILKYLQNTLTPQESIELKSWLQKDSINREVFENIVGSWNLEPDEVQNKQELVLEKIKTSHLLINQQQARQALGYNSQGKPMHGDAFPVVANKRRMPGYLSVAASILVLMTLGFYYFTFHKQLDQSVAAHVYKENPRGVKSQIKLPDGTLVWLNASSSISYDRSFSDTARIIELKGEAYFEVTKDIRRPFRVTSGGVTTTALGTSFNIKAFLNHPVKVSLNSGKVEVVRKADNKKVVLQPGQQVISEKLELIVREFDIEKELSWKEGTIYFDDTKFDEMIASLEEWYDVDINIQNLSLEKKQQLKVTGKYTNQSLDHVLNIMSYSMGFEYNIGNRVVTIKF